MINKNQETFLINYEGIDTEDYLDINPDSKDFHNWLASASDTFTFKQTDQFHTTYSNINGHETTGSLNNQCVIHALTGIDP